LSACHGRDVIDVLQEEITEDLEKMAGITPSDKPYSKADVTTIWKSRIPWLMFLMLSATFTSMVINRFENALSACVALTGFIPMLMGTGGNSGSQSSTAVIRTVPETPSRETFLSHMEEIRVLCLRLSLAAGQLFKMFLVDMVLSATTSDRFVALDGFGDADL
jgi:magnesium transporter